MKAPSPGGQSGVSLFNKIDCLTPKTDRPVDPFDCDSMIPDYA